MPRPKRAKVASKRVAKAPTPTTANADETAIQQPRKRGRPRKVDDDIGESQLQRGHPEDKDVAAATTAQSPIAKESAAWAKKPSALERLKARREQTSLGRRSSNATSFPDVEKPRSAKSSTTTAVPTENPLSRLRRKASGVPARSSSLSHVQRQTPQAEGSPGISDDLYGLSPSGEKSQLELQKRIRAQRERENADEEVFQPVPASTARHQPTPSQEASVLALTNFRRRIRQPSILRTRSRVSMQSQSALTLDLDLDDFEPDDESTPLKLMRQGQSTSSPHDQTPPATSSSRKRKLRSPEVQVPGSSPPAAEEQHEELSETEPASDPICAPDDILETAANTQSAADEVFSETMAPPRSSSSLEELYGNREQVQSPPKSHKTRDPAKGKNSTRSKNNRHQNARMPGLSTAALAKLLPQRPTRRRRVKQDAFEIPSSDHSQESEGSEDELLLTHSRRRTTARSKTSAVHTPAAGKTKGRKARNAENSPLSVRTGSAKKTAPPLRGVKRTYGRQSNVSDKENDESTFAAPNDSDAEDEELPVTGHNGRRDKPTAKNDSELAAIAAKFAEIDQWQMEFESVDTGGNDSSSWR